MSNFFQSFITTSCKDDQEEDLAICIMFWFSLRGGDALKLECGPWQNFAMVSEDL